MLLVLADSENANDQADQSEPTLEHHNMETTLQFTEPLPFSFAHAFGRALCYYFKL